MDARARQGGEWLTQRAPRVDRWKRLPGGSQPLIGQLLRCPSVASRNGNDDRWLFRLIAWLVRLLGWTWRVRGPDVDPLADRGIIIGALWHRNLLPSAWYYRDSGISIPVSRSRDGNRIAAVLRALGFGELPRGSSSAGGATSLSGMVRALRAGRSVGVLCDGPRGPARESKPGVIGLARLSGLPIYPVAFEARPAVHLRSWDQALLPLPFARVQVLYGEPITVPRRASKEQVAEAQAALDRDLDRLESRAAALLGGKGAGGGE